MEYEVLEEHPAVVEAHHSVLEEHPAVVEPHHGVLLEEHRTVKRLTMVS
jgi:hypothetical protein